MTTFYSAEPICTYVASNGTLVSFISNRSEVPDELVAELTRVAGDPSSHITMVAPSSDLDTVQVVSDIKNQAAKATLEDILKMNPSK